MNQTRCLIALGILAAASTAVAQRPPLNDPFLDHLTGEWVLEGTIAGKKTTHDIEAHWAINHHYVVVQENSREKDATGHPAYEAEVYISYNPGDKSYGCVWLDVYGGLGPVSLGMGRRDGNELPFLFKDSDSTFHTTFTYRPENDSWDWRMDSEEKGKLSPFGRMVLTRVKA